jgi:hypothetical protein
LIAEPHQSAALPGHLAGAGEEREEPSNGAAFGGGYCGMNAAFVLK